jgi:ribonuclease VapC
MSALPPSYVLDTSAGLALIEDEPGADTVQRLLEEAGRGEACLLVSFISYMEVVYLALQERDAAEAQTRLQLMTALPAERVESTSELGQRAAEVKARYRLSVADAWIAALSLCTRTPSSNRWRQP